MNGLFAQIHGQTINHLNNRDLINYYPTTKESASFNTGKSFLNFVSSLYENPAKTMPL